MTNEVTPIKIGDLLYLCSAHQILFALDAKTARSSGSSIRNCSPIRRSST